jgi:hypothetical protein
LLEILEATPTNPETFSTLVEGPGLNGVSRCGTERARGMEGEERAEAPGGGETARGREGETTKRGGAGAGRDGETARGRRRSVEEPGRGETARRGDDEAWRCRRDGEATSQKQKGFKEKQPI